IVCLGLPLSQYKTYKDQLRNYILRNRIQNIEFNGQSKKIIIEDVYVFSEGLAFYYTLNNEIKNMIENKDIVILDIGGRTTDVCLLSCINNKRKVEKYATYSIGILNIYNDIVKAINEKYGVDLKLEQGKKIYNEGFYYNGIKQDLSFIKPILKNIVDELFKEININFNLKTSIPLLAGGGGIILESYFKKRCPHAILINEPIFGNAM
ncbi:MAG: ParM/StbA family protein, partial [Caloramator sp.]|nr:ParM/StbA family protein [Caloramator sp.]